MKSLSKKPHAVAFGIVSLLLEVLAIFNVENAPLCIIFYILSASCIALGYYIN